MTMCQPNVQCIGTLNGNFTQGEIVHSLKSITIVWLKIDPN